jgi:hypothetical protein
MHICNLIALLNEYANEKIYCAITQTFVEMTSDGNSWKLNTWYAIFTHCFHWEKNQWKLSHFCSMEGLGLFMCH